jgi:NADH:ubiquinone oxidoreductase subunit 2 (subunit N)
MFFVGQEGCLGLILIGILFITSSINMFYYFRLLKIIILIPKKTDYILLRKIEFGSAVLLVSIITLMILSTFMYVYIFDMFMKLIL